MSEAVFTIVAKDGARILVRRWPGVAAPRAVVQIAHGLTEHSARYARLAAALNGASYEVWASDHRGHGTACDAADLGHLADSDGWAKTVGDLWAVNQRIAADLPGVPVVLLGHSMGSYLARTFAAKHSDALAGLVLSASDGAPAAIERPARLLARIERLRVGRRGKSRLLNQLMFADHNKPFQPARTPLDWLSRDPAEVDAYIADPLCGFPFTTQLAIDMLDARAFALSPASLASVRKTLPIYAVSGARDPVGPNIQRLFSDLKTGGFSRVTTRLYPDARHETFNETNRDEVTRDLVAWLDGAAGR
jgi:alpha-beta hydrolase superfamily lysophospholipase